MRIKLTNLDQTLRLLEVVLSLKVTGSGPFDYEATCFNQGTKISFHGSGYKNKIKVAKSVIRRMGVYLADVVSLAKRIQTQDASQSTTQRSFQILLDGHLVVRSMCNTVGYNGADFTKSQPWQRYTMEEAKLVAAAYLLTSRRDLLPTRSNGEWFNPALLPGIDTFSSNAKHVAALDSEVSRVQCALLKESHRFLQKHKEGELKDQYQALRQAWLIGDIGKFLGITRAKACEFVQAGLSKPYWAMIDALGFFLDATSTVSRYTSLEQRLRYLSWVEDEIKTVQQA